MAGPLQICRRLRDNDREQRRETGQVENLKIGWVLRRHRPKQPPRRRVPLGFEVSDRKIALGGGIVGMEFQGIFVQRDRFGGFSHSGQHNSQIV